MKIIEVKYIYRINTVTLFQLYRFNFPESITQANQDQILLTFKYKILKPIYKKITHNHKWVKRHIPMLIVQDYSYDTELNSSIILPLKGKTYWGYFKMEKLKCILLVWSFNQF